MKPIQLLLNIINSIDLSADHYRDYLTSGSKESWDNYHVTQLFGVGICVLHDDDLLDPKYDDLLVQAVKIHDLLDPIDKYQNRSEEVLSILHQIKGIILPITITHLKQCQEPLQKLKYFDTFKERYLKNVDPEFYSLLQNQL